MPHFRTCIPTPIHIYALCHGVTLIPWPPQEPTPLRFPVWLGIPKPTKPYPLLRQGAVRNVGSHLGRIPNCTKVPDNPPPPPTKTPIRPAYRPNQNPLSYPLPLGAFGQRLVGGG